ncbi:MAG: hypothetical protein JO212_21585 [Acetobacteraceae bacterium]|nr:hypothetical protein [Acetobacteraceae bacterium]
MSSRSWPGCWPPPAHAQPLVSVPWLAAHQQDPSTVVLDIRPAAEHLQAHVPGAVSADYEHAGWRVKLPSGAGGALPPPEKVAATIGRLGVSDTDHAVIVGDDFGAAARVYWTFRSWATIMSRSSTGAGAPG